MSNDYIYQKGGFKKLYQSIRWLLDLCLMRKWFHGSTRMVFEPCPFCYHADVRKGIGKTNSCSICYCPTSICNNQGTDGYIHELRSFVTVNVIYDSELHHMVDLFNKEKENLEEN